MALLFSEYFHRITTPALPEPEKATQFFMQLIQAAQEDEAFQTLLLSVLQTPPFHRKSLLATMAHKMREDGLGAEMV